MAGPRGGGPAVRGPASGEAERGRRAVRSPSSWGRAERGRRAAPNPGSIATDASEPWRADVDPGLALGQPIRAARGLPLPRPQDDEGGQRRTRDPYSGPPRLRVILAVAGRVVDARPIGLVRGDLGQVGRALLAGRPVTWRGVRRGVVRREALINCSTRPRGALGASVGLAAPHHRCVCARPPWPRTHPFASRRALICDSPAVRVNATADPGRPSLLRRCRPGSRARPARSGSAVR